MPNLGDLQLSNAESVQLDSQRLFPRLLESWPNMLPCDQCFLCVLRNDSAAKVPAVESSSHIVRNHHVKADGTNHTCKVIGSQGTTMTEKKPSILRLSQQLNSDIGESDGQQGQLRQLSHR